MEIFIWIIWKIISSNEKPAFTFRSYFLTVRSNVFHFHSLSFAKTKLACVKGNYDNDKNKALTMSFTLSKDVASKTKKRVCRVLNRLVIYILYIFHGITRRALCL